MCDGWLDTVEVHIRSFHCPFFIVCETIIVYCDVLWTLEGSRIFTVPNFCAHEAGSGPRMTRRLEVASRTAWIVTTWNLCLPLPASSFNAIVTHCPLQYLCFWSRANKETCHSVSLEECCDALMCSNYTCTTDYDGDGQGPHLCHIHATFCSNLET